MEHGVSHVRLMQLHAVGLKPLDKNTLKIVGERGNKFWLFALVSAVVLDAYKLSENSSQISTATNAMILNAGVTKKEDPAHEIRKLKSQRKELFLQFFQDVLDVSIPASALDFVKIEPGIVGLIGTFTSIMGARTQWNSVNK